MSLRLLDYNYFFETSGVTVTASSEDTSFPVTNLQKFSRGYPWRSNLNGTFEITAGSNDKINFKEDAVGAEITATLTAGTYTASSLATHIKAQLDAATTIAAVYTVSYSQTTGLWTISSTGAFLSILWSTGTNTATSVASTIGFAAADSTGATSYTGANIAIHTSEKITLDLSAAQSISAAFCLFDLVDGSKLTSSAVIRVKANAVNSFTSPAVNVSLTLSDTYEAGFYYWATAQDYRYWQIEIIDPRNTNFQVEIAKLVLGEYTVLTRSVSNGFAPTLIDQSKVVSTAYGHEYVDEYPQVKAIEFNLNHMPYADLKTLEAMFKRVGRSKPIVAHLYDVNYDNLHFFVYGKFQGSISSKHTIATYFTSDLSIKEIY